MAAHLDLEEQEQLDQLKAFWAKWGNLLTWLLIAVLGAYAAWNGWNYWQRKQSLQASALYEELERAVKSNDATRVERVFTDLRDQFGRSVLTPQGAFLYAKFQADQGKFDAARPALEFVVQKASDEGHQALARLRLAALLIERKDLDGALTQLSAKAPTPFAPLFDDRRGDVLALQGKSAEAIAAYQAAWKAMDERMEYRRLVEVKLVALGADPKPTGEAKSAAGASQPKGGASS